MSSTQYLEKALAYYKKECIVTNYFKKGMAYNCFKKSLGLLKSHGCQMIRDHKLSKEQNIISTRECRFIPQ